MLYWISHLNYFLLIPLLYSVGYPFSALILLLRRHIHLKSFSNKWEYYKMGRDPLTKKRILIDSLYMGAFFAVGAFCIIYAYGHRS